MYDPIQDTYCYEGTTVLKNIPGLRTQLALNEFEAISTLQRSDEPLPGGVFDVGHYQEIHRHLFQDVYAWAGAFRTTRISKEGSSFCYPEHITVQMRELFSELKEKAFLQNIQRDQFIAEAAQFLATLNAIHPFREGNGRTQIAFVALLADTAGHPLDLEKIKPKAFLVAMVESFGGNITKLTKQLTRLSK